MQNFMMMLGTMSLQASIIIVVVLVLRKIFAKLRIAKKYMMLLWIVPFFCLIFPGKISVPHGFWQTAPTAVMVEKQVEEEPVEPVVQAEKEDGLDIWYTETKSAELAHRQTGQVVGILESEEAEERKESDWQMITGILGLVWGIGVIAFLVGNMIRYMRLKNKLLCSVEIEEKVSVGDDIDSPMVVGVFRPHIYLPTGLPEEYRKHILAHEKTHIRRMDTLKKIVVYTITCVHWFNPMVWVAFWLFSKDMEMTCDEETIGRIGMEEKESYAKVLLEVASGKALKNRIIFAAPIAFEEGDVKSRIKNIMRYKKNIVIVAACAVMISFVVAGVFMTTTKVVEEKLDEREYYQAFIQQIEEAAKDDFKTVSTEELGISEMFNYAVDNDFYTFGYNFVDLDADGVYELLFGADDKYEAEDDIYNIYTFRDGKIYRVAEGMTNDCFYLCENSVILHERYSGSHDGHNAYYNFENGQWKLIESIVYDERKDTTCTNFYNKKTVLSEDAMEISVSTASTKVNRYNYRDIRYVPFAFTKESEE